MKIAIVVLLHEYKNQQKKLITYLSKDFDIYVHIDKKSKVKISEFNIPNVYTYKEYKIYWGSINLTYATLLLFKKAAKKNYDRYILISGSDIPLKPNKEIYDFFSNNNKEYLSYTQLPTPWWNGNGGFDRIDFFHANNIDRGNVSFIDKICIKITNIIIEKFLTPFMKKHNIRRRINNLKYYGGANWMDLTDSCIQQIIHFTDNNPKFIKKFKYTNCADEIFFQTIILNYCKNLKLENNLLRYIDWESGPEYPRTLRTEDFYKLKNSKKLFARKFNSEVDYEIINAIYKKINTYEQLS